MLIILTEEQLILSYCWQALSPILMNAEEYHWNNLCLVSAKAEEEFYFYSLHIAAESAKARYRAIPPNSVRVQTFKILLLSNSEWRLQSLRGFCMFICTYICLQQLFTENQQ